jgi:ATP-binding cassette subfamily B (MDR/TAP) protein 1
MDESPHQELSSRNYPLSKGLISSLIYLTPSVFFSVLAAANAVIQIAPILGNFSQGASAARELFETIDRKSAIDSSNTSGHKISSLQGEIVVRDVDFSYPARPDTKVLHGVSFSISPNKVTALVGSSGSGKSTIVGLLERWYDPLSGQVTIDGIDIRQLNTKWLRSSIRLVAQVRKYLPKARITHRLSLY